MTEDLKGTNISYFIYFVDDPIINFFDMTSRNLLERIVHSLTLTVLLCHFGIQGQDMSREEIRAALLKIANEDARDISDDALEQTVNRALSDFEDDDNIRSTIKAELTIRNLPFLDFDQECRQKYFPEPLEGWKIQDVGYEYTRWRQRFLSDSNICNPFKNLYCKEIDNTKGTRKCKCREGAHYMIGHKRSTPSGKSVNPRDMCVLLPGHRCDVDSDEESNDENNEKWPREQLDIFTLKPSSIPKTACEFYNGGTKPACFGLNYMYGKYCLVEDHMKKSKELRNHFTQASTLTLGQPCNLKDHNILYAPEKTESIEDRFRTLDSLSLTDAKFCNSKSFLFCSPVLETCELKFPEFLDKDTRNLLGWPFLINACEALGEVGDVLSSNHYVGLEEGNYFTEGIPECPEKYECDMSNVCLCPDQYSIGKNCDEKAMDLLKFARKSGIAIDAASEDEQLTMISRLNRAALQFEGKFTKTWGAPCKLGVNNLARNAARRLLRFKNKNISWTKAEIEKLTNDIEKLLRQSDFCEYGFYPNMDYGYNGVGYGSCEHDSLQCRQFDVRRYVMELIFNLGGSKILTCGQPCYVLELEDLHPVFGKSDLGLHARMEVLEDFIENRTRFCGGGMICQPSFPNATMGECACATESADCCEKPYEKLETIRHKGKASSHSHSLHIELIGVILSIFFL